MELQKYALFPTLAAEAFYEDHAKLKPVLENGIFRHMTPEGYSNEKTGHVTLHLDEEFHPLFQFVSQAVKEYIAAYSIDSNLFDINIVKTWMNIIREKGTPAHNHADAHISFVYYINVPEDAATPITFYNHGDWYEPYMGFSKFNNPAEWNPFNSPAWSFSVKEGALMVFPARMHHETPDTSGDPEIGVKSMKDLRRRRVSLAGDIVLTFKETSAKSMGLQPIKNWRTF
jgi:uncharacterized protein (TIGR02466 family)